MTVRDETRFLVAVMGPTASGKTALAEALAGRIGAVLVNADAFQVYRGLDIGTGKPAARERYRLLDIVEPSESFGVGEWVVRASAELGSIWEQGRSAVVVGGTGLYVRALLESYRDMRPAPDPRVRREVAEFERREGLPALVARLLALDPGTRVDLSNPVRVRRALERRLDPRPPIRFDLPPFRVLKVGIVPDVAALAERISRRVDAMLASGWREEVRDLAARGVTRDCPAMRAIGYRALFDEVVGVSSSREIRLQIATETRQYAKRQMTWLRSEPRLTVLSHFGDESPALEQTLDWMNNSLRKNHG
ncbi:MAG: tRNA (adenosine(37)-N6)-dimethylallyltransferase MiaA [Fimbriimonadaceae bacterium]